MPRSKTQVKETKSRDWFRSKIDSYYENGDGYYKPEEIVLMPIPGSGSKESLFCVKMYCKM